jgi:hypothetical protein
VSVFTNFAAFVALPGEAGRVVDLVLRLLADTNLEVRRKAGTVLGGLLHCSFIPPAARDELLARFQTAAEKKLPRRPRDTEDKAAWQLRQSEALIRRHTGKTAVCRIRDPVLFYSPGSGMIRDPVHFYLPDPGSGSGMEQWSDPGSGIKHPGSATLGKSKRHGAIDISQYRLLLVLCAMYSILTVFCLNCLTTQPSYEGRAAVEGSKYLVFLNLTTII